MKWVAVKQKSSIVTIGLLFFQSDEHIVLLNNVLKGAHLGPLRNHRRRHYEPEAHIVIIPRSEVVAVEALGSWRL